MQTAEELRILNGYTPPPEAISLAEEAAEESVREEGTPRYRYAAMAGALKSTLRGNHRHVRDLERRLAASQARVGELELFVEERIEEASRV